MSDAYLEIPMYNVMIVEIGNRIDYLAYNDSSHLLGRAVRDGFLLPIFLVGACRFHHVIVEFSTFANVDHDVQELVVLVGVIDLDDARVIQHRQKIDFVPHVFVFGFVSSSHRLDSVSVAGRPLDALPNNRFSSASNFAGMIHEVFGVDSFFRVGNDNDIIDYF